MYQSLCQCTIYDLITSGRYCNQIYQIIFAFRNIFEISDEKFDGEMSQVKWTEIMCLDEIV